MQDFQHRTVLREAVTAQLLDDLESRTGAGRHRPARFLDGTLGGGGHTEALLEGTGPDGLVVGIDRDPAALDAASARLARFGERFVAVRGRFSELATLSSLQAPFDGVVLDLGVSSPQLDQPERGFSFMRDGPLDMRMDPEQALDAAHLLDELDEDELVDILRRYGEEPRARRIARAVLAGRPWRSTLALAESVAAASGYHGGRTHPATRTFQALRYAVNDELGELERGLDAALSSLVPGGRLAVITFNSLEDRIVKHRFRQAAGIGSPRDAYGNPVQRPSARLVIPKGITGAAADPDNPRARSARARFLEKTAPTP